MHIGRLMLMLLAITASGCVAGQNAIPFSDAEFARYASDGPATIQGSALGRTRGGEPKTCAALPVYLAPGTAYVREGIKYLYRIDSAKRAAGPSMKYWREGACDVQGKFIFRNVPAGPWFVITAVEYEMLAIPTSAFSLRNPPTERQGGVLIKVVNLRPGQNDVILTPQDINESAASSLLH